MAQYVYAKKGNGLHPVSDQVSISSETRENTECHLPILQGFLSDILC